MEEMSLFEDNTVDTQAGALEAIKDFGIETYGNHQIMRALVDFYNRGMFDRDNKAFCDYVNGIERFHNADVRDIILGVLVGPVDKYLNTNPSNKELADFISLDYDARCFVIEYPKEIEDISVLSDLKGTGFFGSMSNVANLFMLNHYSIEELKQYQYQECCKGNVIELLLNTIEYFNITARLENLLLISKSVDKNQAKIINLLSSAGYTLDDLVEKFTDLPRFLETVSNVFELLQNKEVIYVEECTFLVHFIYVHYSMEQLQKHNLRSPYLEALFEDALSVCSPEVLRTIRITTTLMETVNCFEFVVDGITTLLLPFDAGLFEDARQQVKEILQGATYLVCDKTPDNKIVFYVTKASADGAYSINSRSFSPKAIVDFNNCEDEYDAYGLMSWLYDDICSDVLMSDLRVKAYLREHSESWAEQYTLFKTQSTEIRYALYLAILSVKGNHAGYQEILSRADLGIPFIKLLRVFIRPDDSFYAAIARYHCAALKLPFNYYNKAFNLERQSVIVNGKEYNVLSIFGGDKSLLTVMQELDYATVVEQFGVVA